MAKSAPLETDESAIPAALSRFIRNRFSELMGLGLLAAIAAVAVCLATWNVQDPSLSFAIDKPAQNALGYPGAVIADVLMQGVGLAVVAVLAPIVTWALRLLAHGEIQRPIRRILMWSLGIVIFAGAVSCLPIPQSWALRTGLGGAIGDIAIIPVAGLLSLFIGSMLAHLITGLAFAILGIACVIAACNFREGELAAVGHVFGNAGVEVSSRITGSITHCPVFCFFVANHA